ncbi:MAG: hypothetical protein VX699_05635 [Myxococcota bacterium]|nr:hypothetical protein [Myxococcota bacterium]
MVSLKTFRVVVALGVVCGLLSGCGGDLKTYEGDLRIESVSQLERYRDYERIDGRLTITDPAVLGLSWPGLVEITGDLWIWDNARLRGFNLSGVERVGGSILVRNNVELIGFDMSSLQSVGGAFSFAYNSQLAVCQIQSVIVHCDIEGDVSIYDGNDGVGNCIQ